MLEIYTPREFFAAWPAIQALDQGFVSGQNRFYRQQRNLNRRQRQDPQPSRPPSTSPSMKALEREAIKAFDRGEVFVGPDVVGQPFIPGLRGRR